MIISEVGIRGFKSYGNNEQVLKLNVEKGELILLVGRNGAGKSALLDCFDFALFGKVRGKKKKWATLSTLPNRINGELLNRIKFKSNGTDIEVFRGISPNVLKMFENGVENDKAGKSNIDDKIEGYIGVDVETFKSFISMSINDFKNFISLSTEEKQLLLDKLFNLEIINILNKILKDLNKSNKLQMAKYDSEINTLNDSIESIKRSIERSIEKEKENLQNEISSIKEEMELKKVEYQSLKEKIEKIKSKDRELKEELDREKEEYVKLQSEMNKSQSEINLYESGKCPTCGTDFDSDHFHNLKGILIEKKKSIESVKESVEKNITLIKERQKKLQKMYDDSDSSFRDITSLLRSYKSKIDQLQTSDISNESSNSNIDEFKKTIIELEEKKSISHDLSSSSKEKELYYKELSNIFGEDGVKKSIISGIIKPINHFINENIRQMELPFQVNLDETFTAEIRQLGSIIEHDSLSTGEQKLTNISILIAYLKLIRTKKHINILFLDEVFSSVDVENIQKILLLLRSFANEYNINIFVVHHAVLNREMFDRIISIEKNIFSSINEMDMSLNF